MYTALYRAYRPEVFDEILGQDHIVRILKNQIATDSVSHAYLFCGTRGTGKTTTARILAKGLNCTEDGDKPCGQCQACQAIKNGNYIDVVEIDAASNNGVDNIRELRESVKYPPATGKKKIYIIDEVHMLSTGAFNALLKTLEEPPEYVVFILATTEPQKLPATILSRCMRLDFKRVPESTLISGMADICQKQGIDVAPDALSIIAANADGSVRDGLSILDQCISGGDKTITRADVLEFLGASGEETFVELTDFVRKRQVAEALVLLDKSLADGKDVRQFIRDWINHYRNLLMTKFIENPQDIINMSVENIQRVERQSRSLELIDINRGILELSKTMNEAKWSTQPRILLEMAIVNLAAGRTASEERVSYVDPSKLSQAPAGSNTNEPADSATQVATSEEENETQVNQTEEPEMPAIDLQHLWNFIVDNGEKQQPSIGLLASAGRIGDVADNTFTLVTKRENSKAAAERGRDIIESLFKEYTGLSKAMVIMLEKDFAAKPTSATPAASRSIEDIAHDTEKALGVKVEIK